MSPLVIVAPKDAQLRVIADMSFERGFPMPAVHSKTEGSIIIGEMERGEYRPEWWDDDVPF